MFQLGLAAEEEEEAAAEKSGTKTFVRRLTSPAPPRIWNGRGHGAVLICGPTYCMIGNTVCEDSIFYHRDFRLFSFCLQSMCQEMSSGISFKK